MISIHIICGVIYVHIVRVMALVITLKYNNFKKWLMGLFLYFFKIYFWKWLMGMI